MFQELQKHMTWRAVLIAGLAAGTVFLLTNLILMPLVLQVSPGLSLRYFASLLLGQGVLTDTTNTPMVIGVGLVVHYVLSLVFALVIDIVIHRWGLLVGIVGGALLGLALYGINLYTGTLFFKWFFALHSPILVLSHVLFGAAAGGFYELFDRYDQPLFPQEKKS